MKIFNFSFYRNVFSNSNFKTASIVSVIAALVCFAVYKVSKSLSGRVQNLNNEHLNNPNTVNQSDFSPPRIEKVLNYPGDLKPEEIEKSISKNQEFDESKDKIFKIGFINHPNFDISIRCQNIFNSGSEVLVNAANTHLGGGSGIDGLIHQKGNDVYRNEHKKLKDFYKSSYVEGYASMIESGALKEDKNIENIIVVAGPMAPASNVKNSQLYSCYYNSLELAHNQNKKSIAFPSISTGIFGYPLEKGANISLRAIHDFLSSNPDSELKTISIHFLETETKNLKTYINLINKKN